MIFGVDLGTRRAAVACPEIELVWAFDITKGVGSAQRMRDYPTEIDAGRYLGARLRQALWLGTGLDLEQAVWVAERPLVRSGGSANIQTTVGMSLSAGAFLGQLPGTVVVLKHSSLWKKALGVSGNAGKPDVRAWIERDQPALAALCDEDEDLIDATCIALGAAVLAQAGDL